MTYDEAIDKYPLLEHMSSIELVAMRHEAVRVKDIMLNVDEPKIEADEFQQAVDVVLKRRIYKRNRINNA